MSFGGKPAAAAAAAANADSIQFNVETSPNPLSLVMGKDSPAICSSAAHGFVTLLLQHVTN
jgi:hypothetical protein